MARFEQDREDLLREAVRLVPRGEFLLPGVPEPVFVGFRRGGGPGFYFGPDEVYQFNPAGRLRRAYVQGVLYKAQRGRLVRMVRRRGREQTQLVSRPLSDAEQAEFLERMDRRLAQFRQALRGGRAALRAQVPEQGNLPQQVLAWLERYPRGEVAATPRALAAGD